MNVLHENARTAVRALMMNWMRSALTLSGIVVGVMSIVTLVAILQGVKAEITKQVEGLGANLVFILPYKLDENGRNGKDDAIDIIAISSLQVADIDALKRVPGVDKISPITFIGGSIEQGKKSASALVVATNRDGIVLNPTPIAEGRYFTTDDENRWVRHILDAFDALLDPRIVQPSPHRLSLL